MVIVSATKGEDKFKVLEKTLTESKFLETLDSAYKVSGKSKKDFLITIKPNIMMFTHVEDPVATYTDPVLVEYLIDLLRAETFENITVVESQNVFGNWYQNRDVLHVAEIAGFRPEDHGYQISDITLDKVPHTYSYGRWLTDHYVGRAWKESDFRISFAKNKTHIQDFYTLSLKNIYGTTPMQDKMYEYHATREWYGACFDMLKEFPVNFGIIDAFYSSDGPLGFKGTFTPKHTQIVLASSSLIALDIVGSKMMKLNPMTSTLMRLCIEEWGEPEIQQTGNIQPGYLHSNWLNVIPRIGKNVYTDALSSNFILMQLTERAPDLLEILLQGFATLFEEEYLVFTLGGILSSGISGDAMDPAAFPMRKWDDLTEHVRKQTLRNLEDLIYRLKRRQSIRWEILEFLRSLRTILRRRSHSAAIDRALGQSGLSP